MGPYILLVDCSDRAGLVYNVTSVLYNNKCNILSNGEFVENETNHFFMRTVFTGAADRDTILNELKEVLPSDTVLRLTEEKKKEIVVMATKEHHCLGDLLLRHHHSELNANIKAVISNHEVLQELVSKFAIPFHHVPREGITRGEHEDQIIALIDNYNPEYIILAKYMRILSHNIVGMYRNRMVNIHHSFLPAFIGANPYQKAYDRGVKIIGATAHFVTDDLDEGPIIAQSIIPVDHTHSPDDMMRAGREIEKLVLAQSLKLVFEDRIFVSGNKTVIFD